MSQQSEIWKFLTSNKKTTINKIQEKLNFPLSNIQTYINALHKSKYIKSNTNMQKISSKEEIKLVNNTGTIPLKFNNGILTDFNINKEFEVNKQFEQKTTTRQSLLTYILEALIELDKEEIIAIELNNKTKEIYERANNKEINYDFSAFTKRWREKFVLAAALIETGETVRNSKIYTVNMKKIKTMHKDLKKVKDYNLIFSNKVGTE